MRIVRGFKCLSELDGFFFSCLLSLLGDHLYHLLWSDRTATFNSAGLFLADLEDCGVALSRRSLLLACQLCGHCDWLTVSRGCLRNPHKRSVLRKLRRLPLRRRVDWLALAHRIIVDGGLGCAHLGSAARTLAFPYLGCF